MLKWFKNLGNAPVPAKAKWSHPSEGIIKELLKGRTDVQRIMEEIWPVKSEVGYSTVETSGYDHKKDQHIRTRFSMYFHKKWDKNEFEFSKVPDFFDMVVRLLGYPPVKSYTVGEKKEDSNGFFMLRSSRNRRTVELLFMGEDILYPNPIRIMFDFKFLEDATQDEFDELLQQVTEVAEQYYQNPDIFMIEGVISQARKDLENETQHQQEEPTGSPEQLPSAIDEREITLSELFTTKELRERIRDANDFL